MAVERKRTTTSASTVHTAPSEWRWAIIVSAVFIILISIPLAWATWVDQSQPEVNFTGILSNPLDGATYLSKIQLGKDGIWQTVFRHTPDETRGAYVSVLYNALGQISRYLSLSNVFTYHASRLLTAFLMMIIIAFGINYVVNLHPVEEQTFVHGAFHGALSCLLYALPLVIVHYMYQRKPFKLILIDGGYALAFFALIGGVLAALKLG